VPATINLISGGTLIGADDESIVFDGDITIDTTGGGTNIDLQASNQVNIAPALTVDNLKLDGNTLSSANTNGNIVLDPNGTGKIVLSADATVGSFTGDVVVSDTDEAGTNVVNNVVVLSQASYDALTPNSTTLYFIT
jgi:hypothetical protein